jgi:hypothetical protein
MAEQTIKRRNKQLRKNLNGLKHLCFKYGKLENTQPALISQNRAKTGLLHLQINFMATRYGTESKLSVNFRISYHLTSSEQVRHPSSKIELPEDIEKRRLGCASRRSSTRTKGTKKAREATNPKESTRVNYTSGANLF